jgi:hypothetical protein
MGLRNLPQQGQGNRNQENQYAFHGSPQSNRIVVAVVSYDACAAGLASTVIHVNVRRGARLLRSLILAGWAEILNQPQVSGIIGVVLIKQ